MALGLAHPVVFSGTGSLGGAIEERACSGGSPWRQLEVICSKTANQHAGQTAPAQATFLELLWPHPLTSTSEWKNGGLGLGRMGPCSHNKLSLEPKLKPRPFHCPPLLPSQHKNLPNFHPLLRLLLSILQHPSSKFSLLVI